MALNMAQQEMEDLFHDSKQGIRLNYYPPCPQPELVIGIAPHSDPVALTLLLHGNDVQGLEVCQNGKWIPIKPVKNAFVVNVGDILEVRTITQYPQGACFEIARKKYKI